MNPPRAPERRWRTNVTYTSRTGFIPWRPGYALPARFTVVLDGAHLPYRVELAFVADENGVEARSVTFHAREGGEPIGARRLRDVPLAECITIAVANAALRKTHHDGTTTMFFDTEGDLTEQVRMAHTDPRMSDAHLRQVAEVYRATQEKPTKAVEQHFAPVSYSTAARWVMEARRRGFLPPHRRGGR